MQLQEIGNKNQLPWDHYRRVWVDATVIHQVPQPGSGEEMKINRDEKEAQRHCPSTKILDHTGKLYPGRQISKSAAAGESHASMKTITAGEWSNMKDFKSSRLMRRLRILNTKILNTP